MKYLLLSFFILLQVESISAQKRKKETKPAPILTHYTQTVRGIIIDKETQQPLVGANIELIHIDSILGTSSDIDGKFKLENVPVGRRSLAITYLGYKEQIISNLEVITGHEKVLTIALEEEAFTSTVVTVIANQQDKDKAINEMALSSVRQFRIEESERYAGSRADVSRMAANYAGVAAPNDNRNDIIIRGNSPLGLLWRLEGVDIPNPNHFGGFGTTGGPVSMLNSNVLASSDFFTGAFPAEYGNANAGVFDLKMRKGNNEKFQFLGQLGFNGIELGAEGPLSKKKGHSFLANYRYSTLGLFKLMGINFGLIGTPEYQDLNFKFHFPDAKIGTFTVFGLGGISAINLLESTLDKDKIDGGFGEDLRNGTQMAVLGVSHLYFLTDKSYLKSTIAGTLQREWSTISKLDQNNENPDYFYGGSFLQTKAMARITYHNKLNARFNIKAGLTGNYYFAKFLDSVQIAPIGFVPIRDFEGHAGMTQVFLQGKYKITPFMSAVAGVYSQWLMHNNSVSVEPRFAIQFKASQSTRFALAYGRHAQSQPFPIYFTQSRIGQDAYVQSNLNLDFTYSNHAVFSYDQSIGADFRVKLEAYFQHITNAPVQSVPSTYSLLNYGTSFGLTHVDSLVNAGLGRNYGVELTLEKFFTKGYYFLVTASLFQSEYQGSDQQWHSTAFNSNYVANALGGYEVKIGKKKNLALAFNLKMTVAGGRRYTPIDLEASNRVGAVTYVENSTNSARYPTYLKPDLQIVFRNNSKHYSEVYTLSLENFINYKNILNQDYDAVNKTIKTIFQLGIFPSFTYRITF
ncbi:TonB-dependent receptor [Aureispira anguillae]|uniref:TonB-dependent receptor n=1 Tax=Aureispira anguillae TaxID=2864201 RepID=A0A915YL91_9BACT|nr:TonB-dependent receptor [Aureispira anguillae]BDS15283.1 TonB-dependent receptor [Aureispira anguillae]